VNTGASSAGARETSSRRVAALARFAELLDSGIRVPGTQLRFGLDPLIGLIPGVGDAAGALLAAWILIEAIRLGTSRSTVLRMAGNIALDAGVGAIPILGDIFDFAWKANLRNVALLERHLTDPARAQRADRFFVACVIGGIAAVTVALVAAGAVLTMRLLSLLGLG
jgi:Domain of unknown function (DUF4112)